MTDERKNPPLDGEVLPAETRHRADDRGGIMLQLPPDVEGMGLSKALFGQLPYWGAKRTIDAYRKAVESGVIAIKANQAFYEAKRDLEMEKERWNKRDIYRQAAAEEAEVYLEGVLAARARAGVLRLEAEELLAAAKDRQKAQDLYQQIAENNRQAELRRSERMLEEEEQKLAEVQGGRKGSFKQKMRNMQRAKEEYEELRVERAKAIKEYGSEEDLPEWLVTGFDQLEADLAFMFGSDD